MGIVYHPCKKGVDAFDVNFCGAEVLGTIHHALSLPLYRDYTDRVPYKMKKTDANNSSKLLAAKTDVEIKELLKIEVVKLGWGGTQDEFVEWVRTWGNFLATCQGYTAS